MPHELIETIRGAGLQNGGCKMKQRLFRSILLLTGAAVGLVLLLFFWVSCQYITQDSFASLKREANLLIVADGEGNVPVSELQRLQLADRVTLIAPDGHALYDNYADAVSMENHLERARRCMRH